MLIFTHFSEERDGVELLECLAKSLSDNGARPHTVIFTTYEERLDEKMRNGNMLSKLLMYDSCY